MMTNQENTWNNDTDQNQGYATNSFAASNPDIDESRLDDTEGGGNIPGSYSSNESMSGVNSVGDEDDDLATGDDIPEDDELEDDELEEDDYEDADLEEDTDLDGASAGSYTGTINSSLDDPNEMPEEGQSDNEGTGYSQQEEQNQPREGADTSFSEQIDVTPPERHEFPSEGVATKTDFASRDLGRTTGRMVGHEPGTESI